MLSKKSTYAIKALVALAKYNESGWPMRISVLSEKEKIPKKFLENILLELRHKGILGSKMGVNGGYFLLKEPREIIVSDVLNITEGPIALLPCASSDPYARCEECPGESFCSLRNMALMVRNSNLEILGKTSIADLVLFEKNAKQNSK
ncbi:MAG: RrF2 family transcriptional regulator [Flavobacteriales bacterium]